MRILFATLTLFLLAGCAGEVAAGKHIEQQGTAIRRVRGVLAFNFEYSYFSEQSAASEKTFEFEAHDARWSNLHPSILLADPRKGLEYRCISGSGYEIHEKLGPTGRATFVFTTIRSISQANTERECLARAVKH